ncbi:SRPBCC domain-containing protein [Mesorhizobium sp. AR07]|nr:SRPBCC domain-containing protein [Mesorhizobium sp. AR07]
MHMNIVTDIPVGDAVIVMRRTFDAPRPLVWKMMTEAEHVAKWWGGPGYTNPVCEMDVRPSGLWHHVMRFPDGKELEMNFVFVEVDEPHRLVWQHADHGVHQGGPPVSVTTVTLRDLGAQTRWEMITRFKSIAARDVAVGMGFIKPIAASTERLVQWLSNFLKHL